MFFKNNMKYFFVLMSVLICAMSSLKGDNGYSYKSKNLEDPYLNRRIVQSHLDTVPIKDRPSDFTNPYKKNPFDLKDPSSIDKSIEYDIKTGKYLRKTKHGV